MRDRLLTIAEVAEKLRCSTRQVRRFPITVVRLGRRPLYDEQDVRKFVEGSKEWPIFNRPQSPYYWTEFRFRGRRIVRSTGTASRREAETFERKLREELARETPASAPTPSLTLDQACGKYWKEHGRKLADARNVERWLLYCTRYMDKDWPLRELSTKHITDFVTAMETAGIGRIAVNRTVVALQGVINRAAKKWEEPVRVIDWKAQKIKEKARTVSVDRATAQLLLEALPVHIREVVLFLLTTGVRKKEGFELQRSKINWEGGTVNVRVKGGHDRDVLLSPEAMLILQTTPDRGKYVWDTTNWRKHFEAAREAAGIEHFRWHDLRHTFATWLGQSGAPLEVIRDQLGHSSISVTQKYRHVIQGEVRAALHRLPTVGPNSETVVPFKRGLSD